ncbi:TolC family protein [Microbacter margulisiae]|uniref:Outer membrane protein n=1 Tax=Microbacter margulisiae TaxID=1350067 RepID=A0A7W5DSA0_9PORP|nr:TolC family protein [Microbacter margulisiae]MBB3187875.1 outer membrane protein [Microbacter margulisiae]
MQQLRILIFFILTAPLTIHAQTADSTWTLNKCIDYALAHNIQVKQADIGVKSSKIDLLTAKAAFLPSLSGSLSQTFSNGKVASLVNNQYVNESDIGGRYSLNANMTLFNGNQTEKNVQIQRLQVSSNELTVEQTKNSIIVSITQDYLQVLYDNETVKTDQQTVATSEAELKQSKEMLDAGSIAMNDYAQVETQLSTDQYNLAVAKSTLQQDILTLKQLLELGINDSFEPYFPSLSNNEILQPISDLNTLYNNAVTSRPEIKSSQLSVKIATLTYQKSKGAYWPTLSLSGDIGTGNQYNNMNTKFGTQLNNNLSKSIGLTLSIPIFNNRETKSAVEKAQLDIQNAQLNLEAAKKDLMKTIETLYQNTISAQQKYLAAQQQEKSAQISYSLVEDQFNLGMQNTVALLTAKNTYLSAQQQMLQAKYSAILNLKLLNFYQNIPITLAE